MIIYSRYFSGDAQIPAYDESPPSPPTIGEIMKKKKSEAKKEAKSDKNKKTEKKKKPKKIKKEVVAPKSPFRGPFEEMEYRKSPLREIPPQESQAIEEERKEEVKEEHVETPVKEMPKLTKKPEVKVENTTKPRNLNDVLKSPEPKDEKRIKVSEDFKDKV